MRLPVWISISAIRRWKTLPAPTTHPSADLSITVTDEAAVAGQRGTYTIVVTNAGPSDVTGSGNRQFQTHFYRREPLPRRKTVGRQIAREFRKRMVLQRFHLRFDSTNFRALARCVSRTPVCAPGFRKEQDLILLLRIG